MSDVTPPPDPAATRALARLRAEDGAALTGLAALVVDQTTATPIRAIARPRWIASQLATLLEAATRGDTLRDAVRRRLDQGRDRWAEEDRPLVDFVPDEVVPPLRQLVGRPWTPSEGLTRRIVRQPAVRELVADVLEDTIRRFGNRMRAVDTSFGGLGQRAARRGRSLGKGLLSAAGVADAAKGIVQSVSEEFEQVLERRIREFLGDATSRALEQVVGQLSDPDYAETFADFRVALLEEVLDTPLGDLVAEAENMGPLDGVDVALEAIRAQLARDDFVDAAEARVARLLDEAGDGTLGAWLDEVELRGVWTETTTELVAQRLQAVVHTEAFAAWWVSLFADEPTGGP
jgi:hypothetical protein